MILEPNIEVYNAYLLLIQVFETFKVILFFFVDIINFCQHFQVFANISISPLTFEPFVYQVFSTLFTSIL